MSAPPENPGAYEAAGHAASDDWMDVMRRFFRLFTVIAFAVFANGGVCREA